MHMLNTIKDAQTYLFIFFFFIFDMCTFALYGQPMTHLIMSTYIVQQLQPTYTIKSIIIAFVLSIQYFLYCGIIDALLFYFFVITIILIQLRNLLYVNKLIGICVHVFILLMHSMLIDSALIGVQNINFYYTAIKIIATLIIIEIFLLWLKKHDNQDNRCLIS